MAFDPVAVNDSFSVFQGQPLAGNVLANDSDADPGDTLTAVIDAGAANGTLALDPDGSFLYTPNAGFFGADQFSYHANDGTADSGIATVSIIVAPAVLGTSGNDTIDGGAGAQTMIGGEGDDTYVINSIGDGVIEQPGEGTDTIWTRLNNYALAEGSNIENLTLLGVVSGTGNSGNNVITGSRGANLLAGLGGADTLDGGLGSDTATYAASHAGVNVSLTSGEGYYGDADGDILINIENLTGSAFNDTLEGDDSANVLNGGGGVDTVTYVQATSGVTVSLAVTAAQNTGAAGMDMLSGFENLSGSGFDDTLTGNQSANVLTGDSGDDLLDGGAGADTLIGGIGALEAPPGTGGPGNPVGGTDTVTYEKSSAAVNVNLTTGKGQGGDAKGDVLIEISNLIGSAFNDVLTGNADANVLVGGAGDDMLSGGDGDDTLEGGTGNNTINGGAGNNTVSYQHAAGPVNVNLRITAAQNTIGAGIDRLAGITNVTGSGFADVLTGNQVANVMIGGSGNDTIDGGGGTDTLEGDGGSNTFVFGTSFGKDTIVDFKLGQDSVALDHTVFALASKLAAAIGSDDLGNAVFTVNTNNAITFLGVSADDLKLHVADIHIV